MDPTKFHANNGLQLAVLVRDASKKPLDRQVVVKLYDVQRKTAVWHATDDDSQAMFDQLAVGDYQVEVSAVGYKPQQAQVHIFPARPDQRLEVVLERDPNAVNLSATDDVIPKKQRKDAQRAVYALNSNKLKDAQKDLDKVYKVAPTSAQVNFLYGYLFLQLKDLEKSESYLSKAAALDPRRVQTLTLLGRVQLQRRQYADAQKTLEQAVAARPEDWMAHNLLADAYLMQKENEKALQQAQMAVDEGKAAASAAQLVLGEALANTGHNQEGIDALKAFLHDNPNDPVKPQVEALIAKLQSRPAVQASASGTQSSPDLLLAASPTSLPESTWGPPGVDEIKPSVAPGVACPYDQIIDMTGKRVEQLVDNVSQFAATENLLHEQLDRFGNPTTKEDRKFDYLAAISESAPGYFSVDENRRARSAQVDLPDDISTQGFMSLALVFHPDIRGDFQMSCEGLSQFRGQAAWLIYFRQRDDKPSRFGNYRSGGHDYPVRLKGRAWITADSFEIVRMESELVNPVDKLSVEHQIVQYGPVHFKSKNVDLWLPQNVDLYLEINRRRFYRRHSFDQYVLFSTDANEKLPALKAGPKGGLVPEENACAGAALASCQDKSHPVAK